MVFCHRVSTPYNHSSFPLPSTAPFYCYNQAISHAPYGKIADIVWLQFWPCWLTLFAERSGDRAGQQPRWAGLLLPVLSSGVPLLSAILRAPGWLLAVSLLLPGRTGHLSDCHALQLVDSKNAGTSLRMLVGTSGAMLLRSARRPASFVRNVTYTLKTIFHSLCKKKHFKIRQLYI